MFYGFDNKKDSVWHFAANFNTGSQLKMFRKYFGISQREFASAVGYDYTTISKIESQNRAISKRLLKQIESIYDSLLLEEESRQREERIRMKNELEKEARYEELHGKRIKDLLKDYGLNQVALDELNLNIVELLQSGSDVKSPYFLFLQSFIKAGVNIRNIKRQYSNDSQTRVELASIEIDKLNDAIKKFCVFPR